MRMPWILGLAGLVAIAILAVLTLSACGGGMYKPGKAAKKDVHVEGSPAGSEGRLLVDGRIELYWFARGEGSPVLMVHGGPGYPFMGAWKGLEPLTADHRFIYYHQRGSGKSTRPVDRLEAGGFYKNMLALDEELGMGAQLRDIEAFRKALGVERISIIGHSYGGLLAALYAAEYPGRVDRLVLVAPAEVVRMPMKKSSGLYGSVADRLPPEKREAFALFMKRFFDYKTLFAKSERELQELNHEFLGYFAEAFPEALEGEGSYGVGDIAGWEQQALFLSLGRRYDLSGFLAGIRARTLILTGSSDFASEAEILDTYGKIPGAEHRVLSAGHFAFEEASSAFAKIVGDFLGPGE